MITNTLIEGLTPQMVQARLNSIDVNNFYFAQLFPLKRMYNFGWRTIQNQIEKKNVAADLHSDNSTIVRKKRPIFDSARGDIPNLAVSRELSRAELKEYQTAKALAQNPDAVKLVEHWGNDVDFCFNAIQSELEFIALTLLSNAAKMTFTTTNNATYANEFNLDYDVDDEAKVKTATDWANKTSADVIGDLARIIKEAKARSLNPKYAYINLEELYKIASCDQIIKATSSLVDKAIGFTSTPDLTQINAMLARQAWLNGVQLRVIDQTITREFTDGTTISGNPFANARLVLTESEILGTTQYDILQENNDAIIRVERAHTVIKKYGTVEPLSEVTIGQADAVPVLDSAYRNIYVRTDNKEWE